MISFNLDNLLSKSIYSWMIEIYTIEDVIELYKRLLYNSNDKNIITWCKVIIFWLKGIIIDIPITDIFHIKNNPNNIFYIHNDLVVYNISLLDILEWKIGYNKFNLFLNWLNTKLDILY